VHTYATEKGMSSKLPKTKEQKMKVNSMQSTTSHLIAEVEVIELQSRLKGRAIRPSDLDYSTLSQPWNLSVKQNPALIVAAENPQDIQAAVNFARRLGLGIAIQGSGHGNVRPANGALLIHTREMRSVEVDAESMSAWIEAGAKWGEVLEVTQDAGLAPLLGSSPDVGVAGYTLGGGMGWLARKYGLAADSVLDFELVTPQGELILSNNHDHADLFWGLRGAGGSLGIITRFHIKLYPITQVYAGNLFYPVEDAKEVFLRFREWIKTVPDELTSAVVIMNYPPVPAIPEFLRGKSFIIVRGCYAGSVEEGVSFIRYWRDWRAPAIDDFKAIPFSHVAVISNDPVDPMPSTSTGFYLNELSDDLIDKLVQYIPAKNGSPITVMEIRHAGAAISQIDQRSAAFGNRQANLSLQMIGIAATPDLKDLFDRYTNQIKEALAPYLTGGVYLNFLDGEEATQRIRDGYSMENFNRLRQLKAKYDPENLLRHSYQIEPVK
jgi:hypothetical protein